MSPERDGQAHALPVGRMVPTWHLSAGRRTGLVFFDLTPEEDIRLWTPYTLQKSFPISSLPRPSCINPLPPTMNSKKIACVESPFILMKKIDTRTSIQLLIIELLLSSGEPM